MDHSEKGTVTVTQKVRRNRRSRLIGRMSTMSLLALASSTRRSFVRAFSLSSTSTNNKSRIASTVASKLGTSNSKSSSFARVAYFSSSVEDPSSSTTAVSATVEDDLDNALDDLLGSAFEEAGTVSSIMEDDEAEVEDAPEEETKVSAGVTDPKDPNFLTTTNPHWTEVGMRQDVIDVLSEKGITKFTEVQGSAFEPVLAGRDVIGRSRTGTGKTMAFGIPSIHRLAQLAEEKGLVDQHGRRRRGRKVSMITLCPTRELARQVQEEISQVARPLNLFTTVFHGGVSYDPQARALRNGIDVLVGTPGRIIDHINRGNLDLSECDIVVLDEADEMLNMGFAEDVEIVLEGVGAANEQKTQCLLFSATTPPWVKEIGQQYQENVLSIDATTDTGARTATTVRHMAIQVPPGSQSKKAILEDIIAVEISKDLENIATIGKGEESEAQFDNPIAAAAAAKKKKGTNAMQQKIFGKTIVFTETKRDADELVSGGVFKSLTAQALHGDVGQKQRDATLNAFRAGAFNVLVATDVAARGIDIKDVDLVVQFEPPREIDTYVHRSGRTGRAGQKGTSVLLFDPRQARDIVKIERSLGHGFKFELAGPPSSEAALVAASKTSAIACKTIPDETSQYFKEAAKSLLSGDETPEDIVAKCLAAISRRAATIESRSLLTGESGFATIEMANANGRSVTAGDVMFTVSKLSRMSKSDADLSFDGDVGKIQANPETGVAAFDMGVEDAKNLIEFSKDIDAGGNVFKILRELELERGRNFGQMGGRGGRGGYGRGRGGYGRGGGRGRGSFGRGGGRGRGGYGRGGGGYESGYGGRGGGGGRFRKTPSRSNYENRHNGGGNRYDNGGGRGGGGGGYSDGGW